MDAKQLPVLSRSQLDIERVGLADHINSSLRVRNEGIQHPSWPKSQSTSGHGKQVHVTCVYHSGASLLRSSAFCAAHHEELELEFRTKSK